MKNFKIISELENIKQNDVKAETKENKLRCPLGTTDCGDGFYCVLNQYICDWECDCLNCADEPPHCFKDGELDEKYINRKVKENPQTKPMIPVN